MKRASSQLKCKLLAGLLLGSGSIEAAVPSGPASYCDSAAVALLASSDSKVSVTIPTFLSRYISILDSACLNRFNSQDPVGLAIIFR